MQRTTLGLKMLHIFAFGNFSNCGSDNKFGAIASDKIYMRLCTKITPHPLLVRVPTQQLKTLANDENHVVVIFVTEIARRVSSVCDPQIRALRLRELISTQDCKKI